MLAQAPAPIATPTLIPTATLSSAYGAAIAPRQTNDIFYSNYGYDSECYNTLLTNAYSCYSHLDGCSAGVLEATDHNEAATSCYCTYGIKYLDCYYGAFSQADCFDYILGTIEWRNFQLSYYTEWCGSIPPSVMAQIEQPTSVSLSFETVEVTTVSESRPNRVGQPLWSGTGALLSGECTSTDFTLVDAGATMYYAGFQGCNRDRPECCPWPVKARTQVSGSGTTAAGGGTGADTGNNIGVDFPVPEDDNLATLASCAEDYYSVSGGCCPNGFWLFTSQVGGQTPCWSSETINSVPELTAYLDDDPADQDKSTSAVVNIVWTMRYEVADSSSGGLSTAAKAGIGAGAGVAAILIAGLGFCLWRSRRKTKKLQAEKAQTGGGGAVAAQNEKVAGQPTTGGPPQAMMPPGGGPMVGFNPNDPQIQQQQQHMMMMGNMSPPGPGFVPQQQFGGPPPPGYVGGGNGAPAPMGMGMGMGMPSPSDRTSLATTTNMTVSSPQALIPQDTGTSNGGVSELSSASGTNLLQNAQPGAGGGGYFAGAPSTGNPRANGSNGTVSPNGMINGQPGYYPAPIAEADEGSNQQQQQPFGYGQPQQQQYYHTHHQQSLGGGGSGYPPELQGQQPQQQQQQFYPPQTMVFNQATGGYVPVVGSLPPPPPHHHSTQSPNGSSPPPQQYPGQRAAAAAQYQYHQNHQQANVVPEMSAGREVDPPQEVMGSQPPPPPPPGQDNNNNGGGVDGYYGGHDGGGGEYDPQQQQQDYGYYGQAPPPQGQGSSSGGGAAAAAGGYGYRQ